MFGVVADILVLFWFDLFWAIKTYADRKEEAKLEDYWWQDPISDQLLVI